MLLMMLIALFVGCAEAPKKQLPPAAFWPPYPDEPRVQFLTSINASTDVEAKKSKLDEMVLGKEDEQSLMISKPYGVDMYQGKIYVCDIRKNSLTVLDLKAKHTLQLGKSGNDQLDQPVDVKVAPDGMKYVADLGKGLVVVYDPNERNVGSIGHKDLRPASIAIFQNTLYVSDFKGQRVEVYDRRSGQLLRTIGAPGQAPGQFIRPLGMTVDAAGNLYVMDVLNCKLQKFDVNGKLVSNWGTVSNNAGGFVRPKHIAVDKDGTLYVVDAAFQNVQLMDQIGRVYTFFGSAGTHPGAMFLPAGISVHEGDLDLFAQYIHPAFQAQRLILVTNQFGDNKIAIYAMGHLKQGTTVADISNSQGLVPDASGDAKMNSPAPLSPTAKAPGEAEPAAATQPATQP
jgi:hypothetical protein